MQLYPERGFMVMPIDGGPVKFMAYAEYIESTEWRTRVTRFKADAGWKCEQCEGQEDLTGHHLTYRNIGNEPREDIAVLCWPCHEGKHQ